MNDRNFARTVGVFFGSNSTEHSVSITTAKKIIHELLDLGFNVAAIYINKNSNWSVAPIDKTDEVNQLIELSSVSKNWQLALGKKGKLEFSLSRGLLSKPKKISIDIAFPAFHGLNGEDGTFQGLCNLLQVPYVGLGSAASVLTMDKVLTKDVLNAYDLPSKPFVFFTHYEWKIYKTDLKKAIKELEFPVFIKPARTGSGLGISKLEIIDTLEAALTKSFDYDNKIMVEEAVQYPAELLVSVTGNYFDPQQIQVSSICIYDSKKREYRPLKTSNKEINHLQNLAKRIFTTFELTGICQIDMIRNQKTKETFVTEIDAMPRDLAIDIWRQSGVQPAVLLRELIRLADQCVSSNN